MGRSEGQKARWETRRQALAKEAAKLDLKCTVQQMMRVIKRQIPTPEIDYKPEHKMVVALFACAVTDLTSKSYRHSAVDFFNSDGFDMWCDLVNIDADSTRQLLITGGFLN